MKKNGVSTWKIAATYIGTVVGAGFATGQEILQFFVRFGKPGLLGILLAAVLFVFFGSVIMGLGNRLNARSHLEIIRYSSGRFWGNIADALIPFFLFGSLTAMMAGTGALLRQQLGLPVEAPEIGAEYDLDRIRPEVIKRVEAVDAGKVLAVEVNEAFDTIKNQVYAISRKQGQDRKVLEKLLAKIHDIEGELARINQN